MDHVNQFEVIPQQDQGPQLTHDHPVVVLLLLMILKSHTIGNQSEQRNMRQRNLLAK
jgi:hypothetical protein